jgi:predicted membrane protein
MAHNTDGNKSVTPIDNALIEKLKKSRNKWALIFLVLVCLAYIVPYTLLTNVPKVYGAFLFWWVYSFFRFTHNTQGAHSVPSSC